MQTLVRADRASVRTLLPLFDDANFRHSWSYAEFAAGKIGASSEWYELREEGRPVALANVRIKRLPLGLGGVALVSGGPLVRRKDDPNLDASERALSEALRQLADELVRRRGLKLRVQAPIGTAEWNTRQAAILERSGLVPSPGRPVYRTMLKSIEGDEAALRASLAQKWRNQLNSADRQGLTSVGGDGPELFARFAPLFSGTRDAKGFTVDMDLEFYRRVREHCEPNEPAPWITIVSHGGQDVSGHLGMYLGDTGVYLLGGTTDEGRRLKAAYWAQWQVIRHARSVGCRWYDLGGIDPDNNPGVFHFKEGVGGRDVVAAGPAELSPRGVRARLTGWAEAFHSSQALRRLRKRFGRRPG